MLRAGAFTGNIVFAAVIQLHVPDGIRGPVFSGAGLIWQSVRPASLLPGGLHVGTAGICAVCCRGGARWAAALRGLALR